VKPELLGEKVIKVNGCMTVYEQYYDWHPCGSLVKGLSGEESRVIKQVMKVHVFEVKPKV
jgi:hypothetical protein